MPKNLDQWWKRIERRFLPAYVWESDQLTLWRERIIMTICLIGVVFGPFSLIPSLILSYLESRWDIFALGLVTYLTALVVVIWRNQTLRFKAWLCFAIFYLLGLGLILNLGPFGAGYIFLFGGSIMAAAMIGFGAAIFSLVLNLLILSFIGLLLAFNIMSWSGQPSLSVSVWVVMLVNFMLVDTVITMITAVLLGGLKRALATEKKVSENLRLVEERFRLIVENLPLMIFGYDHQDELTIWNRECARVTGFSAAEAASNPEKALLFEADKSAPQPTMAQWLKESGVFQDHERAVKCRDGSPRIISWTNLSDIAAVPGLKLWAIGLDVTARREAEQELLDASHKNRLIFENATEGILVIQKGLVKFFNRKVAELLGYAPEELIEKAGLSFLSWIHPEDRDLVAQRYLDRQRGEEVPTVYQIRLINKAGTTVWIEISSTVITWEEEPATLTFMTDITERKLAEDLLREGERRFKEMADLLPTVIVEIDLEGRIIYSNQAGFSTFGYSPEDLEQGLSIADFVTESEVSRAAKTFERVIKNGVEPIGAEFSLLTKNHKTINCLAQIRPMINNGRIKGARVSLMDITEAKRTRLDLEASEEKHRTILKNIEEGYYEVDLEGNFIFFNQGLVNILGYPEKELQGLNYKQLMDEKTIDEAYRIFVNVFETGKPASAEDWVIVRLDGSTRIVETSLSLMKNPEGKRIGFQGVARDVTEREKLREAQRKSIEAEAASQAKTDFLARMSHEIRTPLNAIIGMTELALDDELNDRQKKVVDIIKSESEALMSLVNQVLDFSKIEAQRLELEHIPFELARLLEDIADSAAVKAHEKGLECILYIAADVPTRLVGDPGRIMQIITNLLGNAVKFTQNGEVYLKVESLERAGDEVKLRFIIKDTGIGISEEKISDIFEPFTQADGSTTRIYGGTGLGTTISKKLAEIMGGSLTVESEEGVGSTFTFTAAFSIQPEAWLACVQPAEDLAGKRIMVLDDNPTYRQVLTSYLQSWGCRVEEASDLDNAVALLRQIREEGGRIALLLADLEHINQECIELAAAIKSIPPLSEVPIIVLAGVGRLGDGNRCREVGVKGYLTKPIRRDDLFQVVRLALGEVQEDGLKAGAELYTRHVMPELERSRIQILLVEDYPTNQLIAAEHLTAAGYKVELAENGREAVQAFQRRRFDLILMDIQMPVMDGYEATRAIREIEFKMTGQTRTDAAGNHIPIIALTAHAFKGYRQKCMDAGMDDYLTKPILRKDLLDIVEKWSYRARRGLDGLAPVVARNGVCALNEGQNVVSLEPVPEEAPIDLEKVVDEFMGKEDLVKKAVGLFLDSVEKQLQSLDRALREGQNETVASEAHSIKGGAANLTAHRLSRAAARLETEAKAGPGVPGRDRLAEIEKEFAALKDYLRVKGAVT